MWARLVVIKRVVAAVQKVTKAGSPVVGSTKLLAGVERLVDIQSVAVRACEVREENSGFGIIS